MELHRRSRCPARPPRRPCRRSRRWRRHRRGSSSSARYECTKYTHAGSGRPANSGERSLPRRARSTASAVLHAVGQAPHRAGEHPEPATTGRLLGVVVQESACRRRCRGTGGPARRRRGRLRSQPGAFERLHAATERADTRQHDAGGVGDDGRIGGQPRVGTDVLERLLRRAQVADAVVEHGDQRRSASQGALGRRHARALDRAPRHAGIGPPP